MERSFYKRLVITESSVFLAVILFGPALALPGGTGYLSSAGFPQPGTGGYSGFRYPSAASYGYQSPSYPGGVAGHLGGGLYWTQPARPHSSLSSPYYGGGLKYGKPVPGVLPSTGVGLTTPATLIGAQPSVTPPSVPAAGVVSTSDRLDPSLSSVSHLPSNGLKPKLPHFYVPFIPYGQGAAAASAPQYPGTISGIGSGFIGSKDEKWQLLRNYTSPPYAIDPFYWQRPSNGFQVSPLTGAKYVPPFPGVLPTSDGVLLSSTVTPLATVIDAQPGVTLPSVPTVVDATGSSQHDSSFGTVPPLHGNDVKPKAYSGWPPFPHKQSAIPASAHFQPDATRGIGSGIVGWKGGKLKVYPINVTSSALGVIPVGSGFPGSVGVPSGVGGAFPGAIGVPSGFGGAFPGAVGVPSGVGGAFPGAVGVPSGVGGAFPGAVGVPSGVGGAFPGAIGVPSGFGGAVSSWAPLGISGQGVGPAFPFKGYVGGIQKPTFQAGQGVFPSRQYDPSSYRYFRPPSYGSWPQQYPSISFTPGMYTKPSKTAPISHLGGYAASQYYPSFPGQTKG